MSNNDIILTANEVSIMFGGLLAVNNFSCNLRRGELAALIGPNGAGKTTIFNLFSGIYKPVSGAIIFYKNNGVKIKTSALNPSGVSRAGIARTFQNIRLFNSLSTLDNVRIALHHSRNTTAFETIFHFPRFFHDEEMQRNEAEHLLSLFKIADKKNELAKNLPYGEQRKLEIARALALKPELLLLDEPAAGMNPQETEELMIAIIKIRKDFNLTVLLIEHDMKLVMGIAERIMVLEYGALIAEGKPEEIRKNPAVIKAYLGNESIGEEC
ncbi:MAG: ABC transporter ATP-binding protein [Spirochaetaceae bacterium]|jgi:branched-chain amino acid transport system ATP-binding protein|nr:ABC transporter ATP-binding protein [Spirochaetaceae bacterium]